jgi:hypothetical protein
VTDEVGAGDGGGTSVDVCQTETYLEALSKKDVLDESTACDPQREIAE